MHQRIFGLDILRAAAILIVLYAHAYGIIGSHFNHTLYNSIFPDGVMLFFVLSGFLIGSILIKTVNRTDFESKDLINFWKRRWFRTLPAYFVVLTAILLNTYNAGPVHFTEVSKYLLFCQSLFGRCHIFRESWSLCVEEWFYLTVPFLLFISLKLSIHRKAIFLFWIVAIILLVTILRYYWIQYLRISSVSEWDYFIHKATIIRMDSIMFGMLGAYLNFYKYQTWIKYRHVSFFTGILLFILIGIIAATGKSVIFTRYWHLTFEAMATLLLLPQLCTIQTGTGVPFRFFTFISKISYSMYLLNLTPFFVILLPRLKKLFQLNEPCTLLLYLTWTIGGGYFLYKYVEQPMMKVREKTSEIEAKLSGTVLEPV
jgi:peptidoglycan/LPS O-acetylase OafA/YrhL